MCSLSPGAQLTISEPGNHFELSPGRPDYLLVAGGIDLASVKAAMGHSRITTTERYLHARPAGELADRFTRALAGDIATQQLAEAA